MKKLFEFLLMAALLFSFVVPVFAEGNNSFAKEINVSIYLNGDLFKLDKPVVMKSDRILIPVRVIAEKLGAKVEWFSNDSSLAITKNNVRLKMKINDVNYCVNQEAKKMDAAPILYKDTTLVPIRVIAESLGFSVSWEDKSSVLKINSKGGAVTASRGSFRQSIVVIDAGHGGTDPGAVYSGINEKDLNLDISQKLENMLKEVGIKVYMTRTEDNYVRLFDRGNLGNIVKADLLISIHNNAAENKNAHGTMTLYYPGIVSSNGKLTSEKFAQLVQDELVKTLGSTNLNTIQRPNLTVLKTAKMPAILAEIGFMSNPVELKKLTQENYRTLAAQAIKNATLKALEILKK